MVLTLRWEACVAQFRAEGRPILWAAAPYSAKRWQEVMGIVRGADLESEASADSESEAAADNPSALCGTKKTWKGAKALRARVDLLERLYRRSPPLPLSFGGRDEWLRFRNSWAKVAGEKYKEQTGLCFTKGINDCLEQLCCYYAGKTDFNQGSYRDEDDHL